MAEGKSVSSEQAGASQGAALGRRDWLKVMTAVPAAALVPLVPSAARAETVTPEAQASAAGAYAPKALSAHEYKTVTILSDIIIPADDRSGSATQAKTPEFIDDWLGFRGGDTLAAIRGGLTWLDMECNRAFSHDFIDCSGDQQTQMLDRIAYPKTAAPDDAAGVAFFNHLRGLVVSGFFSSEMGVKDLPYLGNQMVAEWKGCPENVIAKLGVDGRKT